MDAAPDPTVVSERYIRQARLPEVGPAGQAALARASVFVVGAGATGTVVLPALVRAGVGTVRFLDRDVVERSNLQRQWLYGDADAREARPKAEAAARALEAANPDVRVEAFAEDLDHRNVGRLLAGADCVIDATDNFETRFLINDWSVRTKTPWIYIGAVGTSGHTLTILPGETACFRCYLPEPPPPGAVETCETAGVLGPAVLAIGSFAVIEALKVLMGRRDALRHGLLVLDAWRQEVRTLALERDPGCPCCVGGQHPWIEGEGAPAAERLCGRDAIMVRPPDGQDPLDLARLAARLREAGGIDVREGAVALRLLAGDLEATVFPDGRAIVRGTQDPGRARAFCARYVG